MAAGQLGSGAQLGHLMNPPTVAGSLGPAAVGRNNAALSSLSQLLVRQPAASIWGASTAPILGENDFSYGQFCKNGSELCCLYESSDIILLICILSKVKVKI